MDRVYSGGYTYLYTRVYTPLHVHCTPRGATLGLPPAPVWIVIRPASASFSSAAYFTRRPTPQAMRPALVTATGSGPCMRHCRKMNPQTASSLAPESTFKPARKSATNMCTNASVSDARLLRFG